MNAPDPTCAASSPAASGWHGRLALAYRSDRGRTVGHDRHTGPLRVLRSLHPEGPAVCHHVLVHPPGGIVGGDTLEIEVTLAEEAHALITTPGATRFYRSAGAGARQGLQATLAPRARLEWLPMETIVHSGTLAVNAMRFSLAPGAEMIGWDLLSLGLPAVGSGFDRGRFEQSIELPGEWLERGILDADDARCRRLLRSPLGFDGRTALATMWCSAGSGWNDARREALSGMARDVLAGAGLASCAGVTSPTPRVVVVRALAHRIEPLWRALQGVRAAWRDALWTLPPATPRIWST